MHRSSILLSVFLLTATLWAQSSAPPAGDTTQLRQEIEQLKKSLAAMEARVAAQEKANQQSADKPEEKKDTPSVTELHATVQDLRDRVRETEQQGRLNRLQWTGDYRFEANMLRGHMPAYYNGMNLQNYLVKTMWITGAFQPNASSNFSPALTPAQAQQFGGMLQSLQTTTPAQFGQMTPAQIQGMASSYAGLVQQIASANYGAYEGFTNGLKFSDLKGFFSSFTPAQQQVFMGLLMAAPNVRQPAQDQNVDALFTNRLRLGFKAKVADNINFDARLSMYKVFGDSTGVQVFNGQANSLNIDGTTAAVPTGDYLRVERAFFSWNRIAGSPLYLSIGRRPSTMGPPMNFREDEPRGGTPSGALINYQFDGITLGYNVGEKTTLRACWGQGFSAAYGNGLQTSADKIKGVQFFGGNIDFYNSDKTLIQATIARAWNVTDGFPGLMASTTNFLTGDSIAAPVIMRFQPSANLGAIDLYGLNLQRTLGPLDIFVSGNMNGFRPNGKTGIFGGLGSDPFETPRDHNGTMVYAGLRFNVPQNDGRTKLGFEINHGSKYWFNFAQAEDDIFMPKTATRGEAYETYLTHRINDHFIFRGSYQHLNFRWSGSGWNVGSPHALDRDPQVLGFPTYDHANVFVTGLIARF